MAFGLCSSEADLQQGGGLCSNMKYSIDHGQLVAMQQRLRMKGHVGGEYVERKQSPRRPPEASSPQTAGKGG